MSAFKFEKCTSKQYVRTHGWIPEARVRRGKLAEKKTGAGSNRPLRYLTFCAEHALDVKALERAKIIKRSETTGYDSVCFFDRTAQAVANTQAIISGATGFPIDFFSLMNVNADVPDDESIEFVPEDAEEDISQFRTVKEQVLYRDLYKAFPFDVINLDVERYAIVPHEPIPGRLFMAWDKILDWQKRKTRYGKKEYAVDGFTVFFTTRIGPRDLPEAHRELFVRVVADNLTTFPAVKEGFDNRFGLRTPSEIYDQDFDEFFGIAIPKALLSRALPKDWMLDTELSYRVFEFDRATAGGDPYTMLHFILHFRRCSPPYTAQFGAMTLPPALRADYERAVATVFGSDSVDVDTAKVAEEPALREQLRKLGVEID